MVRWLSRLAPPPASGDPRDTIRWVRRMEIAAGVARILRRAERRPELLIGDPDRRKARGWRAVLILVPLQTVIAFVVGYLIDGWPAALFVGGIAGISALGGVWFYARWVRT
jgi:hypothetical protein